ncbi:group II intron maturase-specific domain-containing protein [Protofrankia symbiont of Coriaria ruscifolia]|uniref:group II intron maturase-specific domain-containing protein n=1 Tax=Protofrankia symbiont of Coriaria ruscifolia TaxID=1306542 RepID=UPI001F5FB255|nr:group II intron maturase-specific domain-containing protein [Protofrankia symbiont of Coriaria ruscifolia]
MLANLFLHYAFDVWMEREHPTVRFERYCDDAVVHCVSEGQAHRVARGIADRMAEVGLKLHPAKTRIVYCKDGSRRQQYPRVAFTFLGFTFRPRPAWTKNGVVFASFQPAISNEALKRISGEVRQWRLHHWVGLDIDQVARRINPIVRGWMQYYGAFYRSVLNPLLQRINGYVMRWLRKKYRRLRNVKRAAAAWQRITSQQPRLFAHWAWAAASWRTG